MRRILIVEDDPGIRETVRLVLANGDVIVEELQSGDKIFMHEFCVPDLFILDRQLSGVDGLDVLQYLKKHPATAHVPVLMLSASPHILRLAQQLGGDGALEKPFHITELKAIVAKLISPGN